MHTRPGEPNIPEGRSLCSPRSRPKRSEFTTGNSSLRASYNEAPRSGGPLIPHRFQIGFRVGDPSVQRDSPGGEWACREQPPPPPPVCTCFLCEQLASFVKLMLKPRNSEAVSCTSLQSLIPVPTHGRLHTRPVRSVMRKLEECLWDNALHVIHKY